MGPKRIFLLVTTGFAFFFVIFAWHQLVYQLDSREIAVFQRVMGQLECEITPGPKWRFGASVEEYRRRDLYEFKEIRVRYNDGAHATVSGKMNWEMPSDCKNIVALHQKFGSQRAIDQQLVRQQVESALRLTAPLMSSTESYAARQNEFLQLFSEQVENGIYRTESIETKQPDPITGEMKTVKITRLIPDNHGGFQRQNESPMHEFGLTVFPPVIEVVYDPDVEAQIKAQRDQFMQVQTKQAQAKNAEQDAITAEKNGQALAARAKWDQEAVKAKFVTQAEQEKEVQRINAEREAQVQKIAAERDKLVAETAAQRDLNVAQFAAQSAEQYRIQQTKIGEGDAERKRLVFNADGALAQKIDGLVRVNGLWADAYARNPNAIVPQMVVGGGATDGGSVNPFNTAMQVFTLKSMKELQLDMGLPQQQATQQPQKASR